jgi:EAL domain-containing protein (putative c-di-GMP-specific phosphodiesterase class I)
MIRPQAIESESGQEYRLLDTLERLGRTQERRWIIQIHLSRLGAQNRRDHHMRIAANVFAASIAGFEGEFFRLSNNDLFLIFKGASPHQADEAVSKLRRLFRQDPLAANPGHGADDQFCSVFDTSRDLRDLLLTLRQLQSDVMMQQRRHGRDSHRQVPPIDPHHLGELVDTIASADLSGVMRRQTVFALTMGHAPQRLFRELFISVAELQKTVLPDYDIFANRALFQCLTETLDRRMLALIIRSDEQDLGSSYSLNLNVSTILGPEFLAFDAALPPRARGTIVIEVQIADVYADLSAYQFARDFAQERGYRLLLDGVTDISLPYLDRERLGIDLLKLHWHPEMGDGSSSESVHALGDLVAHAGKARVILGHVDSESALRWGHSIGISMFQGRYLDQLVQPRPALRLS